jgi:uncharacterized membrane-anchored protein YitT (DUF2179 family)
MLQDLRERLSDYQYLFRIGVAVFYAILVAIALNFFWRPGNIYTSGFTGLAQIISALTQNRLSVPVAMLLVNLPLLILAWVKISQRFALFSILAVTLATLLASHVQVQYLIIDPLINAIFGGAINGFAVGMALRNGVATGGLDILGIFAKRKYNIKMGPVNLAFNALIMLMAGVMNGWPYAFYSIVGLVVNAIILSMVYTSQQQMQVMIVTDRADDVATAIQNKLRRGVTIIDAAHGAYTGDPKKIILMVITQQEQWDLEHVVGQADEQAFSSIWKIERTSGQFYEKQL